MNPDSTPFPQPSPPLAPPQYDDLTALPWGPPPPPRPKFQHRYTRHLIFFALTFFTTTFAPAFEYVFASIGTDIPAFAGFTWEMFRAGLWYSVPLLIILGAHEFGHYFACRYHDVDATLPYFLPAPLPLTGTFGAVIRIREAFPSRKALFDIGVAGPIAGFLMLLPFLIYGVMHSRVIAMPHDGGMLWLGEPLLLKALMRLQFGNLGDELTIVLHPMGQAAWWGMLATALNLMPFGQLDGGHLAYAVMGRRASWISMGTLAAALILTANSSSWISVTVMMLVMSVFLGFRHPRVRDEISPIGRNRLIVFAFAWVIFVLCFMPVPLSIVEK